MWFVYIIRGKRNYIYTGITNNLSRRLKSHNLGSNFATKPYKPFKLIAYFALRDKVLAANFEKYLKTASGKRFLENKKIL